MKAPSTSKHRAAFTLTEMLVVIAIIAVLAAVLVTVTGKIRQSANSTKCAGGMRQIGIAMISHASENNGRLPAARAEDPNGGPGKVWFEAILPHLGETAFDTRMPDQTLICPVWLDIWQKQFSSAAPSDWRRAGYGMSYVMAGSPTKGGPNWAKVDYAVRLSEIPDPGRTIMVAEENGWNWGLHAQNYANSTYFKEQSGEQRGLRHGKGANYLFVDGHVLALDKSSIYPYLAK